MKDLPLYTSPVLIEMSDRRAEPRYATTGSVTLEIPGHPGCLAPARLIDVSTNGFRASHQNPELVSGQEVRFDMGLRRGRARIVWSRIMGDSRESGFLILDCQFIGPVL